MKEGIEDRRKERLEKTREEEDEEEGGGEGKEE